MTEREAITVELPKDLANYLRAEVAAGRHPSVAALMAELVETRQQDEAAITPDDAELDALLAPALADIEAGRVMPAQEAFDTVRRRLGLDVKARAS